MAMHEFPPLLPDEVIERAKKLNPALLADGMKGLGILKDGVMEACGLLFPARRGLCYGH